MRKSCCGCPYEPLASSNCEVILEKVKLLKILALDVSRTLISQAKVLPTLSPDLSKLVWESDVQKKRNYHLGTVMKDSASDGLLPFTCNS